MCPSNTSAVICNTPLQSYIDDQEREGKNPTIIFCNTIRGKLAAGLLATAEQAPIDRSHEILKLDQVICKDHKAFWRLVKKCNLDTNPSEIYKSYILQGFKKLLKCQLKQIRLHKLLVWDSTASRWVKNREVQDMSDEELGSWLVNQQRKENQDYSQLTFVEKKLDPDGRDAQHSQVFPTGSVAKAPTQKNDRVGTCVRRTTPYLTQDEMAQLGQQYEDKMMEWRNSASIEGRIWTEARRC